jgi:hypothetical protein
MNGIPVHDHENSGIPISENHEYSVSNSETRQGNYIIKYETCSKINIIISFDEKSRF